jgi:hypothetical protein
MIHKVIKDPFAEKKDPSQKPDSELIPESEDEYLQVKKKWKWKPSRLIFLWLGLEIIKISYIFSVIYLTNKYLMENNINIQQTVGIVIFMVFLKKWWYSSNESK